MSLFRTIVIVVLALLGAYYGYERTSGDGTAAAVTERASDSELERAYEQRLTAHQVRGRGVVQRVLADDEDGSRHQRFILRLRSGQTVLVAHNIDLAPRVAGLKAGDAVEFYGEYEWNSQGGVIHWTHHDPQGSHVTGWLEHDGRRYQ